jgi:hypothetical protein
MKPTNFLLVRENGFDGKARRWVKRNHPTFTLLLGGVNFGIEIDALLGILVDAWCFV